MLIFHSHEQRDTSINIAHIDTQFVCHPLFGQPPTSTRASRRVPFRFSRWMSNRLISWHPREPVCGSRDVKYDVFRVQHGYDGCGTCVCLVPRVKRSTEPATAEPSSRRTTSIPTTICRRRGAHSHTHNTHTCRMNVLESTQLFRGHRADDDEIEAALCKEHTEVPPPSTLEDRTSVWNMMVNYFRIYIR